MTRIPTSALALLVLFTSSSPALPCSLCSNLRFSTTLRDDAVRAQVVIYGPLTNPRLNGGAGGITDLHIEAVIKSHTIIAGKKIVELPQYVPVDNTNGPLRYLVFCAISKDKLDPYRGIPMKPVVVEYLKGALAIDSADRLKSLLYFFNYLDHADPEIAQDAFMEFVRAGDQEIGQIAGKLPPDKLRSWLKDPQTPSDHLSLYAFLLGSCGVDADAGLFQSLLRESGGRALAGYDGLLSGYIQLRPKEGWNQVLTLLREGNKPLAVRFAALRTLRLYHGWKPEESRPYVMAGLAALLTQGELADQAVEDLRRWQIWDQTPQVLACYGRQEFNSPIMRRAIVRYALSCPLPASGSFVADLRRQSPELVRDVSESMQFEKQR